MDYSAQIAVIIGKPLTFRHYPYPYTLHLHCTLDMGFSISSIQGTYLSGINACLNPLALPLGYLYPIFIFILIFPDSLRLSFFSTPRCMGLQ